MQLVDNILDDYSVFMALNKKMKPSKYFQFIVRFHIYIELLPSFSLS